MQCYGYYLHFNGLYVLTSTSGDEEGPALALRGVCLGVGGTSDEEGPLRATCLGGGVTSELWSSLHAEDIPKTSPAFVALFLRSLISLAHLSYALKHFLHIFPPAVTSDCASPALIFSSSSQMKYQMMTAVSEDLFFRTRLLLQLVRFIPQRANVKPAQVSSKVKHLGKRACIFLVIYDRACVTLCVRHSYRMCLLRAPFHYATNIPLTQVRGRVTHIMREFLWEL